MTSKEKMRKKKAEGEKSILDILKQNQMGGKTNQTGELYTIPGEKLQNGGEI